MDGRSDRCDSIVVAGDNLVGLAVTLIAVVAVHGSTEGHSIGMRCIDCGLIVRMRGRT